MCIYTIYVVYVRICYIQISTRFIFYLLIKQNKYSHRRYEYKNNKLQTIQFLVNFLVHIHWLNNTIFNLINDLYDKNKCSIIKNIVLQRRSGWTSGASARGKFFWFLTILDSKKYIIYLKTSSKVQNLEMPLPCSVVKQLCRQNKTYFWSI